MTLARAEYSGQRLSSQGNAIAATGFTLDFDTSRFHFDDSDANGDGLPDAVRFHVDSTLAQYAQVNNDGRSVDVALYGMSLPLAQLSDGLIATVELQVLDDAAIGDAAIALVNGSAGSTDGRDVAVTVSDGVVRINEVDEMAQFESIFLPLIAK